jgi:hypothetical protein
LGTTSLDVDAESGAIFDRQPPDCLDAANFDVVKAGSEKTLAGSIWVAFALLVTNQPRRL